MLDVIGMGATVGSFYRQVIICHGIYLLRIIIYIIINKARSEAPDLNHCIQYFSNFN